MRFKGSLILFALAVVLAGYYLVVEQPRHREREASRVAAARLSDFSPDDVVALSIHRPDGEFEFVVAGTRWLLLTPLLDVADESTVMTLLSEWAASDVSRDLGAADDAARYGLDNPVALAAVLESGDTVHAYLGAYNVDRSRVYATRRPGGDVLLVPTGLRRYAGVDTEDFRNRRVIAFDTSVIDSFDVVSGDRAQRWTQTAAGWRTRHDGHAIDGDPVAIDILLRTLRGLRVRRFPPDAETAGLFAPLSAAPAHPGAADYVRIYKRPPNPCQLLSFVPGRGGALARLVEYQAGPGQPWRVETPGNGRVVEVDSTVMSVFSTPVSELREKHLLHFEPARVARIAVTSPDTIATLVRTGNTWTAPNPGMGAMNPARVRALVAALARLEALRVVKEEGAASALGGDATFTLALYDDGGTLIDELSCRPSAHDPAIALATSRSLPVLCEVAADALDGVIDAIRRINR